MAYRFFIDSKNINWESKNALIQEEDVTYKIRKVLRLKENDTIILLDGKGFVYQAKIAVLHRKNIQCVLISKQVASTEAEIKITIAQSLIKGQRFEYALQKNTEIGVSSFVPLITERTIVKVNQDDIKNLRNKEDRLEKIVRSAAEQSERAIVPSVKNIMSLQELLNSNLTNYDLKIACVERNEENKIKKVLDGIHKKPKNILILIGPEGGFSQNEIETINKTNFLPLGIGKRIYRAETVGTIISSIIYYHFNDL